MTKTQAREKLESEIVRLTRQPTDDGTVKNGTVTFGWFVRNRYLSLKEADWREETAKVKKYLKWMFGAVCARHLNVNFRDLIACAGAAVSHSHTRCEGISRCERLA